MRRNLLFFLLVAAIAYQCSANKLSDTSSEFVTTADKPAVTTETLDLGPGKIALAQVSWEEPVELDFMTRAEVFSLRRKVVMAHDYLLRQTYTPSNAVFGQIVDGAPWWGIEGQYFYGSGERSIQGASEESRFILNPFHLVMPEFWSLRKGSSFYSSGGTPYCKPLSLTWRPRDRLVEASYEMACATEFSPEFSLIAYNARDLGLSYIYVDMAESVNIKKARLQTSAYANPQFIHRGGSCGYPGGCNNMSPQTPEIDDLSLLGPSATLAVKLWRNAPSNVADPADLRFVIYFR